MNIKEKLMSVFQKLGLLGKVKADANSLTNEDWLAAKNAYTAAYGTNLEDDLDAEADNTVAFSQESANQVLGILNSAIDPEVPAAGTEGAPAASAPEGGAPVAGSVAAPTNVGVQVPVATSQSIIEAAQRVSAALNGIRNMAAPDVPVASAIATPLRAIGPGTNATHLFGIESSFFDMNKRWNKMAANPRAASSFDDINETEAVSFRQDIVAFSRGLKNRYSYLHANNMLDAKRLAAGEFGTNYDGLADAKVGDQYVILRQDALIARVLAKRDLTVFFPVRYGIQDHDLVFNAFFTEVSQAYQQGEIFKGGTTIEPEMGHVDDAMIKLKFGPMKELERIYLGYLNKEGSDPIKWSMIEFCILNSLETAQVEQNKRRMRGIYVKPETGVAGSYLTASTGILHTLLRYSNELKMRVHDSADYRTYTSADMLETVQAFVADVQTSVTEDMDIDNHVLYLNKNHQSWWIKNIRETYGKDTDFSGPTGSLNVVPDTNISILWMPYLGSMTLMFMQVPGNLQFLEYVPGEMLAMKMEERMELVQGWSTWKEGCSAAFVGRKFATKAALIANNYEWQQIFMNKPSFTMAADATTLVASNGFWQETVNNTAAKAITDITGAKVGVAYVIECQGLTNATTIAKSGKFATITAAYTPTALGDYIKVILNSEGNFLELERCVAGVRTLNSALQPNIPGVR